MSNVKILVCCHKDDIYVKDKPYYPIYVGKSLSNDKLYMVGDDTGDNISEKNKSYCELTGMYWAWKNLKDVDIIGLCHYRRYFDFHHQCRRFLPYENFPKSKFERLNFSIPQDVLSAVEGGSVVISKPIYYPYSLATDYCVAHISNDFRTLNDVILKTQPPQIIRAFNQYMFHNNALSHYNMFLMKWVQFDGYCKWLFDLLNNVEQRTDITHYDFVQKRVFGFMAERLLNVYLMAKNIQKIEKPVLRICDSSNSISPYLFLRNRIRFYIANKLTYSNRNYLG